jgi:hypothetical protein
MIDEYLHDVWVLAYLTQMVMWGIFIILDPSSSSVFSVNLLYLLQTHLTNLKFKLDAGGHWMALYNVHVFCSDVKATTYCTKLPKIVFSVVFLFCFLFVERLFYNQLLLLSRYKGDVM